MPTYKDCLREFSSTFLEMGQVFRMRDAITWFAEHHPDKKPGQIEHMVRLSAVNSRTRVNHSSIKPDSGHDLFFMVDARTYRRWDPAADPAPIYPEAVLNDRTEGEEDDEVDEIKAEGSATEFAYESDLRNFLAKNLNQVGPNLRLYEEEGIKGIEFPVGGRYIDILAEDVDGKNFVVIELKVSRGHDKTVGQILYYMAWVEENLANGKDVHGVIVARKITNDLRLAASLVPSVTLLEYEISFNLTPVES